MTNYFRITAYHPAEDLSVIADSNGKFEKLWQFSAYMVSKGFKIIEVGNANRFGEGNMPKAKRDTIHVILRVYQRGKPDIRGNIITLKDKSYTTI